LPDSQLLGVAALQAATSRPAYLISPNFPVELLKGKKIMTYIARLILIQSSFGARAVATVLLALGIMAVQSQPVTGQWTTNGNNINNSNSGNVGIGGTAPVTAVTPLEVYGPVISTFTGNTRGVLSIGVKGNNPTNLYYRAIDFLYNDTYGPAARIAKRRLVPSPSVTVW
jgi:hypothetical protein